MKSLLSMISVKPVYTWNKCLEHRLNRKDKIKLLDSMICSKQPTASLPSPNWRVEFKIFFGFIVKAKPGILGHGGYSKNVSAKKRHFAITLCCNKFGSLGKVLRLFFPRSLERWKCPAARQDQTLFVCVFSLLCVGLQMVALPLVGAGSASFIYWIKIPFFVKGL